MPIKHSLVREVGWKKKENGRFGDCFVVYFSNEADGEVLFKWSPTLKDIPAFMKYFDEIKAYDRTCKNALDWINAWSPEKEGLSGD